LFVQVEVLVATPGIQSVMVLRPGPSHFECGKP